MTTDAKAYKQYTASRIAANASNRAKMGPVYDSGINRSIDQRMARLNAPIGNSTLDGLLAGGSVGGAGGRGSGTGVDRGPFGNFRRRSGGGEQGPPEPTGPGLLDQIRSSYGSLTDELERMRQQYAQDITQSTGSTARFLEGVDPTAAYRMTAPQFAAPTAASATYLDAIGANPASVQAQRDFMNQMMASQSQSQGEYSRATDLSNNAYRQAQLAELYRNQSEAQAGLNASAMGARTGIGLKQLEQEQAIKMALLEYQLALMQKSAQKGGAQDIANSMPYPNLGNLNF